LRPGFLILARSGKRQITAPASEDKDEMANCGVADRLAARRLPGQANPEESPG